MLRFIQVALGMAVACPERHHVVFDGNSATLMHLGALTTTGKVAPKHFLNVVLNNGAHESVGGQPSAGQLVVLTTIAKASGFNTVGKAVETPEELKAAVETLNNMEGPGFIDVHIRLGIRNRIPGLKVDHKELKANLMNTLIQK
jgi:phosphonopyruvate decarboxylase